MNWRAVHHSADVELDVNVRELAFHTMLFGILDHHFVGHGAMTARGGGSSHATT